MLPLEGLTVIAVEQAVAAPFCSSRLADAGAHVIKVERPEGDFARGYDAAAKGQSSYFVWLIRGQDSAVSDLATQQGPVKKAGVLLSGAAAAKAAKTAYAMFCNDGFWLTAPFKLTDPGARRTLVTLPDGRKGLKVTYDSGGVTPGDSFVWILDEKGIPSTFKMWVSILPIGGIEASWEQWVELPTGAKLSTFHLIGGKVKSVITEVDGGMGTPDF